MTLTTRIVTGPTNGNGHAARRPVRMEVDRHELVGQMLDFETLAHEALDEYGYALQSVCRLPAGPMAFEARDALKALYPRLTRLLNEARLAAGRYDGVTPHIEA